MCHGSVRHVFHVVELRMCGTVQLWPLPLVGLFRLCEESLVKSCLMKAGSCTPSDT